MIQEDTSNMLQENEQASGQRSKKKTEKKTEKATEKTSEKKTEKVTEKETEKKKSISSPVATKKEKAVEKTTVSNPTKVRPEVKSEIKSIPQSEIRPIDTVKTVASFDSAASAADTGSVTSGAFKGLPKTGSLKITSHHTSPTGHVGIPHPSFPETESWVFGLLLGLFFLLVYAVTRSGSLISETIKTFFQVKERSSIFSKATVNDFQIRFFLIIFSVGVASLYAYLILQNQAADFSTLKYLFVLLATLVFALLKALIFDLLGYVFYSSTYAKMVKEMYFNVFSFWGVCLFPVLIFRVYTPYNFNHSLTVISLILCAIAYVLIVFKLFQIFFQKKVASFYILLYLCTLEFLPLFALYQVYKFII